MAMPPILPEGQEETPMQKFMERLLIVLFIITATLMCIAIPMMGEAYINGLK